MVDMISNPLPVTCQPAWRLPPQTCKQRSALHLSLWLRILFSNVISNGRFVLTESECHPLQVFFSLRKVCTPSNKSEHHYANY